MFSIDGIEWPYPCSIERVSEIRPSEISGMLLDKSWFNDVLGTYLQYTIKIAMPIGRREDYDEIYETITAPVDGHTLSLPYNQTRLIVTGRVERVADVFVRLPSGGQYWKGLQFTVVANHPSRSMTLGQMIVRGRTPMPIASDTVIGTVYTYTENGWVRSAFPIADEIAY